MLAGAQSGISFHFGLLALHFLSFWPFGPSVPFILAFCAFHFLSFWPFEPSFPFILAFWALVPFILACLGCHVGSPHKLPKMAPFLNVPGLSGHAYSRTDRSRKPAYAARRHRSEASYERRCPGDQARARSQDRRAASGRACPRIRNPKP